MKYLRLMMVVIFLATMSVAARADNDQEDLNYHGDGAPNVDVWTNKGYDANYYYGEDVAVYFRADQDCYVVVYDVDPSGDINVLYPNTMHGSTYVVGDRIYRIPDTNDDFHMQISGRSGSEHIYAVASYDYMNPPDFMKYINYDYGPNQYYNDDYFVYGVRGDLDGFTDRLNARIANGPYSVAHTRFYADTDYRHHEHYRYWDYGPYDVGSVWVGAAWPGCEVWIDGVFWGIAPILVPRVIVGYHWVWIYYGGYPCYQRYFYVGAHRRFSIDAHFDIHFKDYRYRRDHFRHWVFEEKRYRNEPGFRERAGQDLKKNVRVRSLPPSVIRDYSDRGIIKKDSPLSKRVRVSAPDRGDRARIEKPSLPPTNKPERTKIDTGNKDTRNRGTTVIERPSRPDNDNPRVIVPQKPSTPKTVNPSQSDRRTRQKRLIEKHESDFRNSDKAKSQKEYKPQQPPSRQTEKVSKPQEKSKSSQSSQPAKGKSSGSVEKQKSSSSKGNQGSSNKESRSGNSGKTVRRR
jgi:hypothetical protein